MTVFNSVNFIRNCTPKLDWFLLADLSDQSPFRMTVCRLLYGLIDDNRINLIRFIATYADNKRILLMSTLHTP